MGWGSAPLGSRELPALPLFSCVALSKSQGFCQPWGLRTKDWGSALAPALTLQVCPSAADKARPHKAAGAELACSGQFGSWCQFRGAP